MKKPKKFLKERYDALRNKYGISRHVHPETYLNSLHNRMNDKDWDELAYIVNELKSKS